jgi:phosphoribosylanthranilate isomerase
VAGGLDATNVGEVIRRLNPFGVDVSSGVETSPGIKDLAKMREFVERTRKRY